MSSAPEVFAPSEKAHHLDRHKRLCARSTIGAAPEASASFKPTQVDVWTALDDK